MLIGAAVAGWCVGELPHAGDLSVRARADSEEHAKAPDRLESIEQAKAHLRKWVAKTRGVDMAAVQTRPMPGKATWKYSELDAGPLFALEAVAGDERLRAFVSSSGQIVSLVDRQKFGPLAKALKLSTKETDPFEAARSVSFLLGRSHTLADHKSSFLGFSPPSGFTPPTIKRSNERAALIFFTFTSGRTGSVNPFRHVLLTTTDYSRAELESERASWR